MSFVFATSRSARARRAFGCVCAWLCTAVWAQSPLTLPGAMAAAEQASRALPAQDAAARAARERAVAAAQRPDPVLRFGLDNVPVEGSVSSLLTREPTTARSVGVTQALPDEAKRRARALRFEHDADVAAARRQALRSVVRRDTALAWWALHAEARRLAAIDAQRDEADRAQQVAEAAYRAGRGGQAEVFAARNMLARLADQRLQAEARLADARSTLRRWVGDVAERPLADAPSIGAPAPGLDPTVALADVDPEQQLAAARERAARAMADVAREERRADWSVDLRFAQRGPRFDNMVTLGLSRPLRWDPANRQDRELSARLAEVSVAEAEAEELGRSRRADVERWQQRWRAGLDRLAGYDESLLPLAAARTEAALTAYRNGSAPLQAVWDARQAELALRLERIEVELATASEWVRLSTLIPPQESTP